MILGVAREMRRWGDSDHQRMGVTGWMVVGGGGFVAPHLLSSPSQSSPFSYSIKYFPPITNTVTMEYLVAGIN